MTDYAVEIRKLKTTEATRCRIQTWITRLTRAIGTRVLSAIQWSATTSARLSVVDRRYRRIATILCPLRHTPRRTSRTNRATQTARVAKLLNARTSILNTFRPEQSTEWARHGLDNMCCCRRIRLQCAELRDLSQNRSVLAKVLSL